MFTTIVLFIVLFLTGKVIKIGLMNNAGLPSMDIWKIISVPWAAGVIYEIYRVVQLIRTF
jgi:hypothetical protein